MRSSARTQEWKYRKCPQWRYCLSLVATRYAMLRSDISGQIYVNVTSAYPEVWDCTHPQMVLYCSL